MRVLAFGFPFSEDRVSQYTGLTTGPGVVRRLAAKMADPMVLVSSAASSYLEVPNVVPLSQSITFKGTARSVAPLGEDEWSALASLESVTLEMASRRFSQIKEGFMGNSSNSQLRLRQQVRNKFAYWLEFIGERGIEAYINSNCPHLVDDLIAYEVCRLKGIPAVFPYRLPIVPGVMARLYIPESLYDHGVCYDNEGRRLSASSISDEDARLPLPKDLELIFEEVVLGEQSLPSLSAKALAAQGKDRPKQFIRPLVNPRESGLKSLAKAMIKRDMASFRATQALRNLEKKNRAIYQGLSSDTVSEKPFLYFPLHMQPEASSCPLGGIFSDQLRAVRLIASILPAGWRLLVKEHPVQQFCFRTEGWYKELSNTPGVELVSLDVSSAELQEQCRGVATLTGSAAFEGWLKRKPAIVLGHILYQDAPGIYKVRCRRDAALAVEAIASGVVHSIEDIRLYLGKLAILTFPGHLDAYINPCLDDLTGPGSSNEEDIADRLTSAIKSAETTVRVSEHRDKVGV